MNPRLIIFSAEYFAQYNLGHDIPFKSYTNGIMSYTEISSASRGAIRPTWELLYAHNVQIKGVEAPWTTAYLNYTLEWFGGFEGGAGSWGEGSGHYDGLGWRSLLYHLDESDLTSTTTSSSIIPSSTSTKGVDMTTTPIANTASATDRVAEISSETAVASLSTTSIPSTTIITSVQSTTIATSSSHLTNSQTRSIPGASSTSQPSRSGYRKKRPCSPRKV